MSLYANFGRVLLRNDVIVLLSRNAATSSAVVPKTDAAKSTPSTEAKAQQPVEKGAIFDHIFDTYIPRGLGTMRPIPPDFKEFPERDTKNFPHPVQREFPVQTRFGFIPNTWFNFFHQKTGVSGPYMFMFGTYMFLRSKEFFVLDEQLNLMWANFVAAAMVYAVAKSRLAQFFWERQDNHFDAMRQWEEENTSGVKDSIQKEEDMQQNQSVIGGMLFDAKRENVQLQLESDYRTRVQRVYTEVKRKLDFMIEYESTRRRFQQKHMARWIMDEVQKDITPELERAALQQCLVDLKSLANKS